MNITLTTVKSNYWNIIKTIKRVKAQSDALNGFTLLPLDDEHEDNGTYSMWLAKANSIEEIYKRLGYKEDCGAKRHQLLFCTMNEKGETMIFKRKKFMLDETASAVYAKIV
jgi:hypothetical protein